MVYIYEFMISVESSQVTGNLPATTSQSTLHAYTVPLEKIRQSSTDVRKLMYSAAHGKSLPIRVYKLREFFCEYSLQK